MLYLYRYNAFYTCIVRPYLLYLSMAHFHIKKKKGRPYLYIREIARVNGKPKVISQVYIGSPEKIKQTLASTNTVDFNSIKLKTEAFGALWIANEIDKDINLVDIVDSVVTHHNKESGPTVGEYFLYCIFNRMVHAVSKNKLSQWFKRTAIQHIRPAAIEELTSQRYWQKWERVSEEQLNDISHRFFTRLWEVEPPDSDCLLFDTTNYYTFMASDTHSELAQRGKNKQGRHHLRQIGLGLLVSHKTRLPLYYRPYPGNIHDSRFFHDVMDEMFGLVCGFHNTKERLTVVFDKGINSDTNIEWIDEHRRIHFITNYSTYFEEDLSAIPLECFDVLDTHKNRQLCSSTSILDRMLGYRSTGEYWGKERTVVVTYNPRTARKQSYVFENKMEVIRTELIIMRKKVREQEPHWRNAEKVKERYLQLCERMHLASDFFTIDIEEINDGLSMSFHKNVYAVDKRKMRFGKNIIITDNSDWSTSEIVEANLDRWEIEDNFRRSKDDELVGINPIRHWTDSKIRCHLFSCVVALTYLRLLELRLQRNGINRTAEDVMEDMHSLNSVLMAADGRSKPYRKMEEVSKTQQEVLKAFGYQVDSCGVLQKDAS